MIESTPLGALKQKSQFANLEMGNTPRIFQTLFSKRWVMFSVALMFICLSISPCQGILTISVGTSDSEDYSSLDQAIDSLLSYVGIETEALIRIYDGYYQSYDSYFINMGMLHLTKLTIESVNGPENCTLVSTLQSPPSPYPNPRFGMLFNIWGSTGKTLILKDFTLITTSQEYPIYYQYGTLSNITIEGCKLRYKKGAIRIMNGGGEANIRIEENDMLDTSQVYSSNQEYGSIHIDGESHMNIEISDNEINDYILPVFINSINHSTVIANNRFLAPEDGTQDTYIQIDDLIEPLNSSFKIVNNEFINVGIDTQRVFGVIQNNTFWITRTEPMNIIACSNKPRNADIVPYIIEGNLFYGTPYNTCIRAESHPAIPNNPVDLSINRNSFLNVATALLIDIVENHPENRITSFKNNLIECSSDPLTLLIQGNVVPTDSVNIDNSWFVNGYPTNNQYFIVDMQNCGTGDPYITMDYPNHTYTPIWDNEVRSPLINSGCPAINGIPQTDPDGTPPDIGAVYYPHYHKEYNFLLSRPANIFWKSFPVVDDRTFVNDQYWNELGYTFQYHMLLTYPMLVSASWSYNGDSRLMQYSYMTNQWENSNESVSQPKGFKLKYLDNLTQIPKVTIDGFKADPTTTPIALKREIMINNNTYDFENWIGYFVPYTQSAGNAFRHLVPGSTRETYLDHIYGIETQTWSTKRIDIRYDSPWIIDPNRYTLSEGDMVAIKLLPNAPEEMFWNIPFHAESPRIRELADSFTYTEELDYTPIFIEFDPNDLPQEVGLFVSGVCKGAAVVDSTLIEVNYYGTEAKSGDKIEVMFYYGDKGMKKAPAAYVYNPETLLFEAGSLKAGNLGDYGYISFNRGEGSSLLPLATELKQNYPNPFRNQTNISWVLAKDAPLSVDIYNLKGQKVKTLFSGLGQKGRQSLAWDATDNNGKKVSSGVYFYRLSTPETTKVQKLLVLK